MHPALDHRRKLSSFCSSNSIVDYSRLSYPSYSISQHMEEELVGMQDHIKAFESPPKLIRHTFLTEEEPKDGIVDKIYRKVRNLFKPSNPALRDRIMEEEHTELRINSLLLE